LRKLHCLSSGGKASHSGAMPSQLDDDRLARLGDMKQQPILKPFGMGENTVDSDRSTEIVEVEIESTGRTDLQGLRRYLDQLQQSNIHFQEATYIGNTWYWQGMVPFEHYGFVISTTSGEYITLDFGRRGIVWDIYDDYPDYPDGTFLVEKYRIDNNRDIELTRKYCEDTKPFIFLIYDCQTWSKGLMQQLSMERMGQPMSSSSYRSQPQESNKGKPSTCAPESNKGKPSIYGYVSCM
jgi:hypothetical protein